MIPDDWRLKSKPPMRWSDPRPGTLFKPKCDLNQQWFEPRGERDLNWGKHDFNLMPENYKSHVDVEIRKLKELSKCLRNMKPSEGLSNRRIKQETWTRSSGTGNPGMDDAGTCWTMQWPLQEHHGAEQPPWHDSAKETQASGRAVCFWWKSINKLSRVMLDVFPQCEFSHFW